MVCNRVLLDHKGAPRGGVAIRLRGYVVCNGLSTARPRLQSGASRNPLTGLCGLQPPARSLNKSDPDSLLQSPYGAMWFATTDVDPSTLTNIVGSQSPYGAMWFATWKYADFSLAKFYLSQSPYGAKWFATQVRRTTRGAS